jgi:GAF domain-containing protein
MVLEVATTAGAFAGGITAILLSPHILSFIFGLVLICMAYSMRRFRGREALISQTGLLDTNYRDPLTGEVVRYGIHNLPLGMGASFLAGNISGLLGIGGGVVKVPIMTLVMGIPMRAAIATSNFMIGVTAAASAIIYYQHGYISPSSAIPTALGVLCWARVSGRASEDEERQELNLKSSHGLGQACLFRGAVEVARSGVDRAVLSGTRVALTDLKQDADYQHTEAATWEGLTSVLAVPIALQERLVGVLRVYTGEPHYFNPQEESFLAAVANLGALAIRRAHCFEAFQRIAQNINSSLELEDVLTTLLLESVKELNVKAGSIRLLNPKREILLLAAAYGLSETYMQPYCNHAVARRYLDQCAEDLEYTRLSEEHRRALVEEARMKRRRGNQGQPRTS